VLYDGGGSAAQICGYDAVENRIDTWTAGGGVLSYAEIAAGALSVVVTPVPSDYSGFSLDLLVGGPYARSESSIGECTLLRRIHLRSR
jgi:hypothetical protein